MKNKIVVTELGKKVLEYLDGKFHDIIHKDFTAGVESDLDRISNGELIWTDIVTKIYNTFMPIVIKEIGNKVKNSNKPIGLINEKEVVSGVGKYGPFILYNKKFTSVDPYLKSNKKTIDELTIEDCEKILKYPIQINDDIKENELKSILSELNLPLSGNKTKLIQRIKDKNKYKNYFIY